MPVEEIIERYIDSWKETLSLLKEPVLLAPFGVIGGVKLVLLLLVYFYWYPSVSGFMVPALQSLAGEEFLHFPRHVIELPRVFHIIETVVMLVVGFVMIGWAVFMIDDAIEGKRYRLMNYAGQVSICIPSILLIGFLFLAGVVGIPLLLEEISAHIKLGRLRMLIGPGAVFVALFFEVMLIYSLIFLKHLRGRAFPAVKRSIDFARSRLPLTAMVVLTAFIVDKPFEFLASRSEALVQGSKAEWVLIYLLLGVIIEVFALFYLFASTTSIAFGKVGQK